MALIHNTFDPFINGVSQASDANRHPTQCKEMINCIPDVAKGLVRRNPTSPITGHDVLAIEGEEWTYFYDKGLSGAGKERYSLRIYQDSLGAIQAKSVNLDSGKVNDIAFDNDAAESYIKGSFEPNGYSAITAKDTTFLVNKTISPVLDTEATETGDTEVAVTVNWSSLNFKSPTRAIAPSHYTYNGVLIGRDYFEYYGSTTTVLIDNTYTVKVSYGYRDIGRGTGDYYSSDAWRTAINNAVKQALPSYLYSVEFGSAIDANGIVSGTGTKIFIKKRDGSALGATNLSIAFNPILPKGDIDTTVTATESQWYLGESIGSFSGTWVDKGNQYGKEAFAWIEKEDNTSSYEFDIRITTKLLASPFTEVTTSFNRAKGIASKDTLVTATDLTSSINADVNFVAIQSTANKSSVIKILPADTSTHEIISINIDDSFGGLASTAFTKEVGSMTELPANFGFDGTVLKVVGDRDDKFAKYWVKFEQDRWIEWKNPLFETNVDAERMPHLIERLADGTFIVKQYGAWDTRLVGDIDTNANPVIFESIDGASATVKDVFFFQNRLGFVTSNGICLSEVGRYGNFFRTSVLNLLDSDPISTTVNSVQSIDIEYANYLEDSVILFSDKAQFRVAGDKDVISPKNISVSQILSFNINQSIRPVLSGDKLFFATKEGEHTAVIELYLKQGNVIGWNKTTTSIPHYIDEDISQLSTSPSDNMLFIRSNTNPDTLFCYRYAEQNGEQIQSAWFKLKFNGDLKSIYASDGDLFIMLERLQPESALDWIMADGTWDDSKFWRDSSLWKDTQEAKIAALEKMLIAPKEYDLDEYYDTTFVNGSPATFLKATFESFVDAGKWVPSLGGTKDIVGDTRFRTIQVESEPDSEFSLLVTDTQFNRVREIGSIYTVDKRPMVMGNTKNMNISFKSQSDRGFRITKVAYEGTYNTRSRRA